MPARFPEIMSEKILPSDGGLIIGEFEDEKVPLFMIKRF